MDLYERRKLAIEFKEFVDKYVNPEYRDNFYQFINHILNKYRTEAQYNMKEDGNLEKEDEALARHVEWPQNCTHIKIAYDIWNKKKSQFKNPLEIAQRLKQYYYEETAQIEVDYDSAAQNYAKNYMQNARPGPSEKLEGDFLVQRKDLQDALADPNFGELLSENRLAEQLYRSQPGEDKSKKTAVNGYYQPRHAF